MSVVFFDDFEDGNLNAWDSTNGTVAASATAALDESYGLLCTGQDAYVRDTSNIVALTDVHIGLAIEIPTNSLGAWQGVRFIDIAENTYSGIKCGFGDTDGDGVLDSWVVTTPWGGDVVSSVNFSENTRHWIDFHIVIDDAVNGGVQLWVDDDLVIDDLGDDTSSYTDFYAADYGVRGDWGTTDTLYVDTVIYDDADQITDPANSGPSITIARMHNHLIMQGVH